MFAQIDWGRRVLELSKGPRSSSNCDLVIEPRLTSQSTYAKSITCRRNHSRPNRINLDGFYTTDFLSVTFVS
jgi:hypothetical protein